MRSASGRGWKVLFVGIALAGVSFADPVINSLSPSSGVVGASVTISGSGFGVTQGGVTFNGTNASSITSWTDTSIVAAVPTGATSGDVVVNSGGVNSNAVGFTVLGNPTMTGLTPFSGAVGESVTISGSNFGATQGSSSVSFNGTPATTITSWSETLIAAMIPTGATSGNVIVTVNGVASNGFGFTVEGLPNITSLSPPSGMAGTYVTISGANFGASQAESTVTFNNSNATVASWSDTSIVAIVPSAATSATFAVTVNEQVATSPSFTVTALPTCWSDGDVGSVGLAGSATYASGVFTVKGAGTLVSGTADGVNFMYQSLSGDGSIIARVAGLQGASGPEAGVMIRETLSPGATEAFIYFSPNQAFYVTRASTGGGASTQSTGFGNPATPYWVKITRGSNVFNAYISKDGITWTQVGSSITINMASSVFMGVAVSSGSPATLETATVDHVTTNSSASPAPVITGFSATTGTVGSEVTLSGSNFGATQESSQLTLNGAPLIVDSWSNTSIVFTVPQGATSGPLMVAVAPSMNTSNQFTFDVTSNPLPASWLDQDIGNVASAGSASYSDGVFTVAGAGGISGTADAFHFVYQSLAGDGSIVARVSGLRGPAGPQVGVMIRETLSPSSTFALVYFYPNASYFVTRATTGATATAQTGAGVTSPYWVQLVRSGNVFTAYVSGDGFNWSQTGSATTISMATNVYVGLASTNVSLETATFDNVSFGSSTSPAPVITALSATTGSIGSSVTITGENFVSAENDSFVLLNDAPVTINSWSDTSINITIPPGATSGFLTVTIAPSMNNSNPVRFAVTSQPIPSGWLNGDFGKVSVSGSATFASNVFTVKGGGGIGLTTADAMQFVYQPLSGDGSIVARITSLSGSSPQAGVMIRETLSPSAAMAFVFFSPNQGYFEYRLTTGASNSYQPTGFGSPAYPYWAKLVRSGNSFSAYLSSDGFNWTQIGTTTSISMATNVYIGMTTTGSSSGSLGVSTIDDVSVNSTGAPAPVINSLSSTTGAVGTQVAITGANFGSTQGASQVLLNGSPVTINEWSNTSIVFTVPTGGTSGFVVVSVAPFMNDSNPIYFSVTSQPLPGSWDDQDVGQVHGLTGSATYSGGIFTVAGGGNITSTADAFHFAYQQLAGDGSITARVASISGSCPQVGVMVRETLTASSTFAMVFFQPNQAFLEYRSTTGGSATSQYTGFAHSATPYWVRLIRNGNSFTGFISPDGNTWTQIGSPQTITMATNVYMGLAVSPNGCGSLLTATFDNVLAAIGTTPIITGVQPIIGGVGAQVTIAGLNFGSTQAGSTVQFNGATATETSNWSPTQIVAVVPGSVASGTGPVTVTVNSIVSNGTVAFTAVTPAITSLSPTYGAPGGTVTLYGDGFGTSGGSVYFNGLSATILSWSDTSIQVWVPANATSGPVTVVESGVPSAGVPFTVEGPPTVSEIEPGIGNISSSFTITGTGFGATQESSGVTLNGQSAGVISWSDTQIVAVVPIGGVTGPIGVKVANISTEGPAFTVSNTVTLTNSLSNQTVYTSADIGGAWNMTQVQGTGCSTCTMRGNQTLTYDTSGDLTSVLDTNNNTTLYTWDTSANMLSQSGQSAAGTVTTSYTYNSLGEVLTMTDPLSNVTTNTYDGNGNLLTVTTPSPDGGHTPGSLTQFSYDNKGELTQITDPLNHITTLSYNPQGLIASITDAQNNTTSYGYDLRGNRNSVIDPVNGAAHPTLFSFDLMNRLTGILYPDGSSVSFGYDVRGRRIASTDQNNRTTYYSYDDADRLISVTDPANNTTQYGYDTESNLTGITDANGHTTNFVYDALGRVSKTTFPSTLYEMYGYDGVGNLTSKTDRKNQTIQYVYDAMNRLTSKTYPDQSAVDYVYDLAGKVLQVNDPTGAYSFAYDNMGRLIGTTTQYSYLPGLNFQNGYTYDAASNRKSLTAPDGSTTTYGYDTLNRLNSLANSWAGSFGFGYDALSRRTQLTRPNGVNTNYGYDAVSHLLSALHQLGSTTLDGASYTYDPAGNRLSKTNYLNGVTSNYGYDLLYELTQVTQGGSTTETYSYDPVGNRLSSLGVPNYSYNSSNELNSSSLGSYTYDANGNTLTDAQGRGFTWDFENRLVQAVVPGSNGGTTTFKYDPLGRRIQKSGPLGTTNYLYDGFTLIEGIDSSGNALARYTQDQGIDEPLAELSSSTTTYYQRDDLNSITSLSNSAAALVGTYSYDSFGNLTASTGTINNPFRYTAREFDPEIGLYFNRARYYDSSVGRFVTEDPMGFGAGVNFYDYVSNDPMDNIDPFGWKNCTTRIMLVTSYCSRGPGSDWPHFKPKKKGGKPSSVGPGDVAVANSNNQPYPFGCSVTVTDIATGTTDYTGTTHDTGAGWDASHHDVLPGAWIDIWLPCRKALNYGTRYRTVTICCGCDN